MIELFGKYAYWKMLRYFALNPSSEIYVQELSKKLDLSAGMCSRGLRDLEESGILNRSEKGKAHYYRLVDNYLTRALKRFIVLFQLHDAGVVEKITSRYPDIVSIALYGSYAGGDFDESSDIDMLLIAHGKADWDLEDLEETLGAEINIETMSPGNWLKRKHERDSFYAAVMDTHVLLWGGELP